MVICCLLQLQTPIELKPTSKSYIQISCSWPFWWSEFLIARNYWHCHCRWQGWQCLLYHHHLFPLLCVPPGGTLPQKLLSSSSSSLSLPYTVAHDTAQGCFWNIDFGVGHSTNDAVRSWLRLQTLIDYISHPNHMYTKWFSSFVCYFGWAYDSPRTVLLVQVWGGFRMIGVWLSLNDVVRSWLRLLTKTDLHPTSISYGNKVFEHLAMLWMGIWIPLTLVHLYVCADGGGGILGTLGYGRGQEVML